MMSEWDADEEPLTVPVLNPSWIERGLGREGRRLRKRLIARRARQAMRDRFAALRLIAEDRHAAVKPRCKCGAPMPFGWTKRVCEACWLALDMTASPPRVRALQAAARAARQLRERSQSVNV